MQPLFTLIHTFMITSNELLDLLNERYEWSDYKIAKEIGLTRAAISDHRTGKAKGFKEAVAIKIADLLEMNRVEVVASMHYHRAKEPEVKQFWKGFGSAAAILLTISLTMPSQRAEAHGNAIGLDKLTSYTLCAMLTGMDSWAWAGFRLLSRNYMYFEFS